MFRVSSSDEAVGVDDFVLLENHTDPEAFLDNLRVRYNANIIYVRYIYIYTIFNAYIIFKRTSYQKFENLYYIIIV